MTFARSASAGIGYDKSAISKTLDLQQLLNNGTEAENQQLSENTELANGDDREFDDEALRFVKRENLDRNHYSEGQRAMVGAKLKSLFEEQAKKRQQAAGGDNKSINVVRQKNDISVPVNLPEPSDKGDSRDKAAETVSTARNELVGNGELCNLHSSTGAEHGAAAFEPGTAPGIDSGGIG